MSQQLLKSQRPCITTPERTYLLLLQPAANSDQPLTLKAAGDPKWYHPSSLTSGGRFANKSPAVLARQAAHGMLAAAWHLYTGGRPAECFRMRWDDSSVPGADAAPPVWVLGLAGILQLFQDMPGAGFCLVSGMGSGYGLWQSSVCSVAFRLLGTLGQKGGFSPP
jgi:hypothetical protein